MIEGWVISIGPFIIFIWPSLCRFSLFAISADIGVPQIRDVSVVDNSVGYLKALFLKVGLFVVVVVVLVDDATVASFLSRLVVVIDLDVIVVDFVVVGVDNGEAVVVLNWLTGPQCSRGNLFQSASNFASGHSSPQLKGSLIIGSLPLILSPSTPLLSQ